MILGVMFVTSFKWSKDIFKILKNFESAEEILKDAWKKPQKSMDVLLGRRKEEEDKFHYLTFLTWYSKKVWGCRRKFLCHNLWPKILNITKLFVSKRMLHFILRQRLFALKFY